MTKKNTLTVLVQIIMIEIYWNNCCPTSKRK